ncbi:MAG: peptidoglycan-binding protein [Alphaproteobacteria bacterium]|nr:peptidoglycan-binding protein [Alphaproteobacteria bacterium]
MAAADVWPSRSVMMRLPAFPGRLFLVLIFFLLSVFPLRAADNEAVAAALQALFQSGKADTGSAAANAEMEKVRAVYDIRAYKPIWTRDNGPKFKARALLAELKISAVNGLSPKFYHVEEIEALMGSTEPADLARLDMLLSGAIAEYGHDLANGRIGPDIAPDENAVEPVLVDPSEIIAGAEEADDLQDFAGTLLTADYRYVRLIAKLAEFSRIRASGQWPKIDDGGPAIAPGASDERLPAIRKLLALVDDLPFSAINDGDMHDEGSVTAVKSYQERHGLEPTGEIDAATLAEMSVPIERRIRQIQINLERRRWQNRDLGDDSFYVNLADSGVKVVLGGEPGRAIEVTNAGQLSSLPTFFGKITGVRTVPGAPARIVLTVISPFIDEIGAGASDRSLAITDAPLLAGDLLASHAPSGVTVESLMAMDTPQTVTFERPIQLYVTYVTAWANRDGSVHFRSDVHGRDARLAALLQLD